MLRDYQAQAEGAIFAAWDQGRRAPLVNMATGTGKTEVFTHVAKRCMDAGHPVCVLVDRIELLDNAAERMHKILGIRAGIERGDCYAFEDGAKHSLIVGTFQTLVNKSRLDQFRTDQPWRLIVDEAHLTITADRLRVMRHFLTHPNAKAVGFTATPDRLDGRGMGQFFDAEAYRYEIRDAINDGWLVPIVAETAKINGLTLEPTGGVDYSDEFIGQLMESDTNLYQTAVAATTKCGDRPALVFCARVAHAEMLAGVINRIVGREAALAVHGQMKPEVRKEIYRRHRDGEVQFLCNVGVLTTGFDAPYVSAVVCARPTQSRALFSQMVGRGTRPLDPDRALNGWGSADGRRAWIAASNKPDMLVVHCAPETGALNLVGPVDVLAGDMTDPQRIRKAREAAEKAERYDVQRALADADREIERLRKMQEAMAAKVRPTGVVQSRTLDLFAAKKIRPEKAEKWIAGDPLRERLIRTLVGENVSQKDIDDACRTSDPMAALGSILGDVQRRNKAGLLTRKQEGFLIWRQYDIGLSEDEIRSLSRARATQYISRLMSANKEIVV